ncbi:MAG: hypothetical protein IAF38_05135, partial [Bacteroidia bacterium]|nr:hypothetical protein [Bacteroidia bacterium]
SIPLIFYFSYGIDFKEPPYAGHYGWDYDQATHINTLHAGAELCNWKANDLIHNFFFDNFLNTRWFYCAITLLMSFLLVSELPLFALKFKHFKWKGNEIRFVFLLLAVLMFVFLKFVGIPLVIVLYVFMSIVNNLLTRKKGRISS